MYHMTPDGPRPCKAINGNCPYKNREHGDKEKLESEWRQDMETIGSIKTKLTKAAQLYYQGATDSGMTDEEYDAGINYLKQMREQYDLSNMQGLDDLLDGKVAGGTAVNAKNANKVQHAVPMLSLAKADNREDVENYLRKVEAAGATGFKLQAKFDGIACSAVFENGKLKQMSSRGNGQTGEDMSYLIDNGDVTVDGLPDALKGKASNDSVEIRGELFLRPSEFNRLNAEREARGEEKFANPRNTNAGIVKRAAKGMNGEKVKLQFVMYKIVGDHDEQSLIDGGVMDASTLTMQEWQKTGMPLPGDSLEINRDGNDDKTITDKTMSVIDAFEPVREKTDLSLDGIVVKPINERAMDKKMGSNAHHPLSQLAYKYPGATKEVRVTDVSWTVGKSGKLTPTVTYEAVDLDGSTCTHATLHNPAILEQLGIKKNSIIKIEKRHEILPEIVEGCRPIFTPTEGEAFSTPEHCPYCGSFVSKGNRLAYCPNPKCPSRGAFMLKAAAGKGGLNFDGMGESLIDSLQDSGMVRDVADFYDLTEQQLASAPTGVNKDGSTRKFGATRAKHVMEFIEASKKLPFHKVLSSLSIPDLGPQTAKALIKKYPDIDSLKNASIEDMTKIDGIGESTARKVKEGLVDQWPTIERLRKAGLQFSEKPESNGNKKIVGMEKQQAALGGVKISITGSVPEGYKNRGEWQEFVDAMGGVAQSGPGKDTDYLVWDGARSSSKLEKARKHGVKIISPEDFSKAMRTGVFPDHSTYDDTGKYVG